MISYFEMFLIIVFILLVLTLTRWPQVFTELIHLIGPTEVGLVRRTISGPFSFSDMRDSIRSALGGGAVPAGESVIKRNGEAGYQLELLNTGWWIRVWPVSIVIKQPWPQAPRDGIGVIIAQVGKEKPSGAKTAVYKPEFGNFTDVAAFLDNGGEQGVQRHYLQPGETRPIHPVAFLVVTKEKVYGIPVAPDLYAKWRNRTLTFRDFGFTAEDLAVKELTPHDGKDMWIVTADDGPALSSGIIASRIDRTDSSAEDSESHEGFDDIAKLEREWQGSDTQESQRELNKALLRQIIETKNSHHQNYQDFQKFLDLGGRMGLQHDPVLQGKYTWNPVVIKAKPASMFIVPDGYVGVVKANIGLPTEDISDIMRRLYNFDKLDPSIVGEYRSSAITRPGHVGIWAEYLGPGKYPLVNPELYDLETVPTFVITLNWGDEVSSAHNFDKDLKAIRANTEDRQEIAFDLQVTMRVQAEAAPFIRADFGTMATLIKDVMTTVVSNVLRDVLQKLKIYQITEERENMRAKALQAMKDHLARYGITVLDVFIGDFQAPSEIEEVWKLTARATESGKQYRAEAEAEVIRIDLQQKRAKSDTALMERRRKLLGNNGAAILEAAGIITKSGKEIMPRVLAVGGGTAGLEGMIGGLLEGNFGDKPEVSKKDGLKGKKKKGKDKEPARTADANDDPEEEDEDE